MSDLHERLTAAVNARLEVARAAEEAHSSPWFPPDMPYGSVDDRDGYAVAHEVPDEERIGPFIAFNDPATVIRHCERDLRVLERHAPIKHPADKIHRPGLRRCDACDEMCHSETGLMCDDPHAPYPCDEIRDLAAAYGVEVRE